MSHKTSPVIVSSSHLVSSSCPQLSEFEYGLTMMNNAFLRWMQHCSQAAGVTELSSLDIQVVHNVAHRDRAKKLADICFSLNLEDSHNVAYSLRKLVKLAMITSTKKGKETFYKPSEQGWQFCERYKAVREQCLIDSLKDLNLTEQQLSEMASALRVLSGFYDQSSRSAASL
ncbi:winged helix DNA-binding protein [Psychrobium sp. 1_MG-2023]|uniref:winged helix DNA-binding protein n=1 Tax=Psychrobium sp. 1_MG-2023 TaxID=3062624 RepID=UPI000C33A570|nr:winged helix DNA-binding protein [Psychrobium sp. 1_MG-2023]MDP2559557.1 winged helix DNA-binding protein [Psychrobium sp. 1_MG-2023]PKF59395.1 transcriptional regulator [Alteromonadales bacterium alter-6D02]